MEIYDGFASIVCARYMHGGGLNYYLWVNDGR